jgi:hypothetical protein
MSREDRAIIDRWLDDRWWWVRFVPWAAGVIVTTWGVVVFTSEHRALRTGWGLALVLAGVLTIVVAEMVRTKMRHSSGLIPPPSRPIKTDSADRPAAPDPARRTRSLSGSRSGSHSESSSGSGSAPVLDPTIAPEDQSQTATNMPGPAVSASLTVTQTPRKYPTDPPMTPSQWESVLASKYSVKSQEPVFNIHRDESKVTVGMRFKNIGSSLIRWEMEGFQVSRSDRPPGVTLLTTRGTLEPQEAMVFGETALPDIDPTIAIEGRLDFRSLYGPPQRPRAFWFEETWNFTITPLGDGKFETRYYKARESEGEC